MNETEKKAIEEMAVVNEMASICCRWHDVWKNCLNCWRRTNCCTTYLTIYALAKAGYIKQSDKGGN